MKKNNLFAITTLILVIFIYFKNCTGTLNEHKNVINNVQQNHIESKNIIDSLNNEILSLQNELQTAQTKDKEKVIERKIDIEKLIQMPFAEQQKWFDENYKGLAVADKFNQLDSLQSVNIISDIEKGKTAIARIGSFEFQVVNLNSQITKYKEIEAELNKDLEAHIIALDECEAYLYEAQEKTWLKMSAGASFGVNKELNQFMYGGQLLFEGKRGHVTNLNYLRIGNLDYLMAGKSFKIFHIKKLE